MSESTVDGSLIRGIVWTGGVKWLVQVFGWAATLVVVRHVTPADYGIVGSATLYLGFLGLLADFGVGSAVLKMRELSEAQLQQLNGAALIGGAVAMLLGIAAAWPLGAFFRSSELPLVIVAMSTTVLTAGVRSVPSALLQRKMRFRSLALIEATQGIVGSTATVAFALAGWGYWALCGGAILQAIVYTALVRRAEVCPLAWPRLAELREPLSLSGHIIFGNLSWWTYSNADFVIAGRVLGQATMGSYLLAWEFASLPVEKITNVVMRVTPAVFSALQNDRSALRTKLLQLTEGIATLTMPASIGLALVAPDFVHVAFGESWTAAVVPLRLLCLYVTLRSVVTMLPQILIALGESRMTSRMGIAFATAMPVAFLVGSRWGTAGIATAWLVVFPFLNIPFYRRVFQLLELDVRTYAGALMRPAAGCAAMTVAVLSVSTILARDLSEYLRLALAVTTGVVVYAVTAIWPQRARLVALYRVARA